MFVVSIPDYAYTPFGQSKNFELISAELNAYNQYQKEQLVELGIAYFDITPISQNGLDQAELVAKDGLHPSAAQYALWVAEIMKGVR